MLFGRHDTQKTVVQVVLLKNQRHVSLKNVQRTENIINSDSAFGG